MSNKMVEKAMVVLYDSCAPETRYEGSEGQIITSMNKAHPYLYCTVCGGRGQREGKTVLHKPGCAYAFLGPFVTMLRKRVENNEE